MGKLRRCKYCLKDITAYWPRLKNICDNPGCRKKQKADCLSEMRRRSKESYDRSRAKRAEGRICINCGAEIPFEQMLIKPICFDCEEWWEKEKYRRKKKRQREQHAHVRKKRERTAPINVEEPLPKGKMISPEDWFCQADYEREQEELKKPNGRTCHNDDCDNPTFGPNWYCEECRSRNYRMADVFSADMGTPAGEERTRRAFPGFT